MKVVALIDWFNRISMTNFRILVTLFCMVVIVFDYVMFHHPVDINLLLFLAAMGGLDVAQYLSKRVSQVRMVEATGTGLYETVPEDPDDDSLASTDIQEITENQNKG